MRVAYHTDPAFFESALMLAGALAKRVELHLLLETSPRAWPVASFDLPARSLPSGVIDARPILHDAFPEEVRALWSEVGSFQIVSHSSARSVHPAAWRTSYALARRLRHLKPDVLHLEHPSLRFAWALPVLPRVPLVITVHDPVLHRGEADWRQVLARRLLFPRASRFILHNEAQRTRFCARYRVNPDHVQVVRLGVYDIFRAWRAPSPPSEAPTVLFFGRLSPYKGLEVLYEAIPHVAQRVPGVRFEVAGRPVPGYVVPSAPQAGAPVSVTHEYVSNAHAAALFERSTVVACPYTEATQSAVLLTAYAFGKPVITTRVGGLPEYVEDGRTGLLVEPNDPAALADALVQVLTDAELRRRLESGVANLRNKGWDWSTVAQRTLAVYAAATGG